MSESGKVMPDTPVTSPTLRRLLALIRASAPAAAVRRILGRAHQARSSAAGQDWLALSLRECPEQSAGSVALSTEYFARLNRLSRTRLTDVIGALDLLRSTDTPEERAELIDTALGAALSLQRLLERELEGPASHSPGTRPRSDTPGAKPARPISAAGPSIRVLLAEDDSVNREITARLLEKLGCRVSAVANGAEAIEELGKGRFQLVLMDCRMPVLDGFETTARIRAAPDAWCSTPVVALTADTHPRVAERCQKAGMNGQLAKPIDIEALRRALALWAR